MKENLKNKKGITLIALVITIIVLLILAIVTIRIVVNQNIIGHANNAVTAYNEAQNNESAQLTWVEELMQNKGGSSTSNSNNQNSGSIDLTGYENSIGEFPKFTETEITEIITKTKIETDNHDDTQKGYYIALNEEIPDSIENLSHNASTLMVLDMGQAVIPVIYMPKINTVKPMYMLYNNQWYYAEDGEGAQSGQTEYNGSCPIAKSDFSNIICESYLDKVIASFNN